MKEDGMKQETQAGPHSSIELISREEDGSELYKSTFYPHGRTCPLKVAIVVFKDTIEHVQAWDTARMAAIRLPKGGAA
jgi:hypothetical protein